MLQTLKRLVLRTVKTQSHFCEESSRCELRFRAYLPHHVETHGFRKRSSVTGSCSGSTRSRWPVAWNPRMCRFIGDTVHGDTAESVATERHSVVITNWYDLSKQR